MNIVKLSSYSKDQILEKVLEVLGKEGLVVFPSDTVYGFLADATSKKAVEKLIEFKNRPIGKPISVFLSNFEMLKSYVKVSSSQEKIIKNLLPGPFTLVLESKGKVVDLLESERKTLGVRIPDFPLICKLVKKFGRPVTATSANISGKGPHWSIDSFLNTLSQRRKSLLDLVIDAGKLPFRKPSTVVDLTGDKLEILRKGEIVFSNIKTFVSFSAKQTREIGQFLASKFLSVAKKKGVVFIVEGELGVGKTQLAKGIGDYLGVEKEVISPSFVSLFEYKGEKIENFYHLDLWGIKDKQELEELRIESLIRADCFVFIEWGERVGFIYNKIKSKPLIYIKMEYIDEKKRSIKISSINE